MGVLTGQQIVDLGIVTDFGGNPHEHIQPNGVDVSLSKVWGFRDAGSLDQSSKELPLMREMRHIQGEWFLPPGAYLVDLYETISLPKNMMAYLRPRSTLLRSGVALHTAVWDAGYEGKGQVLLNVVNPHGWYVEARSRIGQIVVHEITDWTPGYDGSYQSEGLSERVTH